MSLATDISVADPFVPRPRLLTAADLAALPTELPSGPVDFELDQGRIVLMSPTGSRHGSLQYRIASALEQQGDVRGYGRGFTEVGVIMRRKPDTVYGPDVAFVVASRLPVRQSPEGYLLTIPDLIVEVRSKNDSLAEMQRKAEDYLQAGARTVWIVDDVANTVAVHRASSPPVILGQNDTLTAEEIIPGFTLPLVRLFG